MERKVSIKRIEADSELYYKYATQSGRQPVYLSLDLTGGVLTCDVNYEINGTPGDVWHGHRQWFGPIPALRSDNANKILEAFKPIAQSILDNLDDYNHYRPYIEWKDDEEHEGLSNQAENFVDEVNSNHNHPEDVWEPYEFSHYYEPSYLKDIGEDGLTTKSTPEEIREAAEHEIAVADYPLDGDVDDLVEFLTEWIEQERLEEDDDEEEEEEELKNDATEMLITLITNVITGLFEQSSSAWGRSSSPWADPLFDKDDAQQAISLAKELVAWTNEAAKKDKDCDFDDFMMAVSAKGKSFKVPMKKHRGPYSIDDLSYEVSREIRPKLNVEIAIF